MEHQSLEDSAMAQMPPLLIDMDKVPATSEKAGRKPTPGSRRVCQEIERLHVQVASGDLASLAQFSGFNTIDKELLIQVNASMETVSSAIAALGYARLLISRDWRKWLYDLEQFSTEACAN